MTVKRTLLFLLSILILFMLTGCGIRINHRQDAESPDWETIKANATFIVHDPKYAAPHIQPVATGGWEDGLYISRDGLNLYAFFVPADGFSLYTDWEKSPICFNSEPYIRPPLIGVDMVTNPWGCENFFQSDIIYASRTDPESGFTQWQPSNLQRAVSNEGAPCGVLKDPETFDVFVFTQNREDTGDLEIMVMRNTPVNPDYSNQPAAILSSPVNEDNPHIERLEDGSLLLFFDRGRYIYYSLSNDNGQTWSDPILITTVLNDQAPYDIQPHLWFDGESWWVYFCRDNENGRRCIYRSKQQITNDWDSWGQPELVIEPGDITGGAGVTIGIGEPTLTESGEISFVAVIADPDSPDKTDVYDCDPWFLPLK